MFFFLSRERDGFNRARDRAPDIPLRRIPVQLHHNDVKLLLSIERFNLDFNLLANENFYFRQRVGFIRFQCFANRRRNIDQKRSDS